MEEVEEGEGGRGEGDIEKLRCSDHIKLNVYSFISRDRDSSDTDLSCRLHPSVFDNALEIITDTDEPSCLLSCKKNPDCQFFTY